MRMSHVQLKRDIPSHQVFTVREKGWNGKLNGELLTLLLLEHFDALIIADKNLQHQQNFYKYPIPFIVLNAHRITYPSIKPLAQKLNELLKTDLPNGPTVVEE